MHITSLAPVLSATSSRVCIWIMARTPFICAGPRHTAVNHEACHLQMRGSRITTKRQAICRSNELSLQANAPSGRRNAFVFAGQRLLGALSNDPDQPPALELGHRARFHDFNQVAEMGLVGLVVHMAYGP